MKLKKIELKNKNKKLVIFQTIVSLKYQQIFYEWHWRAVKTLYTLGVLVVAVVSQM